MIERANRQFGDMPYKSNEVSEMWRKFHELGWNYYGPKK